MAQLGSCGIPQLDRIQTDRFVQWPGIAMGRWPATAVSGRIASLCSSSRPQLMPPRVNRAGRPTAPIRATAALGAPTGSGVEGR